MALGTLTHSPADVLAKLLVDLGHAIDSQSAGDWPAFVNQEPNAPDKCVTTFDTTGRVGKRVHSNGYRPEFRGVQVRIRAHTQDAGWTRANRIAAALDEEVDWRTVALSGVNYLVCAVTRTSGVLPLGDEPGTKRKLFTVNGVMSIKQL